MTDTRALADLHQRIDMLAKAITPVVTAYITSEKAHAEKLGAQAALVDKILSLATETVRAIGTRPKVFESMGHYSGTTERRADWRGLVLTCRPHEALSHRGLRPIEIETVVNDRYKGTYTGSHVFLHEDGKLVVLSYEGSWDGDLAHASHDEWHAKETVISAEAFCRDWGSDADPKNLTAQLLKFIEKAGDRYKATEKARVLADKYRAVIALL